MKVRDQPIFRAFLLVILSLFYAAPGLARSDADLQRDIATRIAEAQSLQGSRIQMVREGQTTDLDRRGPTLRAQADNRTHRLDGEKRV